MNDFSSKMLVIELCNIVFAIMSRKSGSEVEWSFRWKDHAEKLVEQISANIFVLRKEWNDFIAFVTDKDQLIHMSG
jgi:hypothetical protein